MIGSRMRPSALILLLLTQASFLVQRADAADTGAAIPLRMRRAAHLSIVSVAAGSTATVFGIETQSAGIIQADNRQRQLELELAPAGASPSPSTAHA